MRRVTATLALALCLLGCRSPSDQVPLITDEAAAGGGCILLYEVVDVVADPTSGTVVKGGGWPLRWPKGYTAWRVGSEVEVVDRSGIAVLRTGGRYRIGPALIGSNFSPPINEWVVGCIDPCPECKLGNGVANADAPANRDPV
jgi:hypothetical protein